MVRGLDSPLQNTGPAAGIIGGVGQHFGKEALGNVVGARACNKDAARAKKPQGPVIDFFVAAEGAFEAFLIPGKGGWIQDDGVVLSPFLVPFPEEIENIGLNTFDIGETVPFDVGSGHLDRRGGNIDRLHSIAQVTDMNRKTTPVAKSIEGLPVRIAAGRPPVIALVEVGTRLLTGCERDGDLPSIFIHDDCFGERFTNELLFEFKAFEFPYPDIISKEYGTRLVALGEKRGHERLDAIGGLDETLDDEPVAVTVDDQTG